MLTFYYKFNFKPLSFLVSGFFCCQEEVVKTTVILLWQQSVQHFMEWQFRLRIILSEDIDETRSAARQRKKEDTRAWKAFHVRNRIPSYRQCQLTAGIGNWFEYDASFLFGPLFGKWTSGFAETLRVFCTIFLRFSWKSYKFSFQFRHYYLDICSVSS